MLRNNFLKTKIKVMLCGVAGVLMLSMVQLPNVHAEESCFEAVGDTVDYDHGDTLHSKVKATCEMELYSIAISFADTEMFEGIEEVMPESVHSQISGVKVSDDHLHLRWNMDGSAPQANILPGEELFSMEYHVPINTTVFKRNMPITIESAQYKIGDEFRTEENVSLDAILTVTHDGKEALMVTGIEKQEISYNGGPIVLAGDLVVEDNPAGITADDLGVTYYNDVSRVDDPSEPGNYVAVYSHEDENYVAALRVPFTIKNYYTISHSIFGGEGEISSPAYVDAGNDLHVDIIPADGYRISWVDYNGQDVTDLLNDDNSLDFASINEDVEIVVSFIHVYRVTQGGGSTHTIGDNNDLSFIVDKDPYSYTAGDVLIVVDNNYVHLIDDSAVNPEAQTVTLLSHYLDTLEPGEHKLEIYFFDTDPLGVAETTFVIAEAGAEEDEDEDVPVPNTGIFTGGDNGAAGVEGMMGQVAAIAGVVVAIIMVTAGRFIYNRI